MGQLNQMSDRFEEIERDLERCLGQPRRQLGASVASVARDLSQLSQTTADRRLRALSTRLRTLHEELESFLETLLDRLRHLLDDQPALTGLDSKNLHDLIGFFDEADVTSINRVGVDLLDLLIGRTGAERGFLLFYQPDSSAANVVAARNFQTTDLETNEYRLSRTLLCEALENGRTLLIQNALSEARFNRQASVRRERALSVLAVPLIREGRVLGLLYLDERRRPGAFNPRHSHLVETAVALLQLVLAKNGLLPILAGSTSRVFLDPEKASTEIIGSHPSMVSLQETVGRIADAPATILIEGESGTGKELVARALHKLSRRCGKPFVAINCAAIPETLLESELFGHERGAFTGAFERYEGRLEQAAGGTLFLDEVSELAYPLQAKLLRFLQSGEFQRLGGRKTIHPDARIIAATSKNLREMSDAGRFQDALYYRLNVIPLSVPPLRRRKEDIFPLGQHFLDHFQRIYQRRVTILPEVWEFLRGYPFPGNVRELENLIHRLVALAREDQIRARDLPPEILRVKLDRVSLEKGPLVELLRGEPIDFEEMQLRRRKLQELLDGQEGELLRRFILEAGGVTQAARRLKVHRVTLHKKLKSLKTVPPPGSLKTDHEKR